MRSAMDLAPKLRSRIGLAQRKGGWKGRLWGKRAEVRPADGRAGFAFRVLVGRKWTEGAAAALWPCLDKVGAAIDGAPRNEETTTVKKTTTKKTKGEPKAAGKGKMSEKLKELREASPKKGKAAKGEKAAAKASKEPAAGVPFLPPVERKPRRRKAEAAEPAPPGPAPVEQRETPPLREEPAAEAVHTGPVGAGFQKNFFGARTTSVLQWMGKSGFTTAEAKRALEHFGGVATDSTLRTFVSAGKRGGKKGHKVAELAAEASEQLLAYLGEIRAAAPPAREVA